MSIGNITTQRTLTSSTPQRSDGATADRSVARGVDLSRWTYFDQHEVAPLESDGTPNDNACGTTSLAMVLAYFGLLPKDVPWTSKNETLLAARAIDVAIRAWGGFSAPSDLVDFARTMGLAASPMNNGTFDELYAHLDRGRPVMAMIDGGGSPHWVVVVGHGRNLFGSETITYADPDDGTLHTVSKTEFAHDWAEPMRGLGGFLNDAAGYENYMIVFDRGGAYLPSRPGPAGTELFADALTDAANGWHDLENGRVFSGIAAMAMSTEGLAFGAQGVVARLFDEGADRILAWASGLFDRGGFSSVLGALVAFAGGALKIGTSVMSAASEVVSTVASAAYDVGKSVVRGVGNAVSAVGNAIGDFVGSLF